MTFLWIRILLIVCGVYDGLLGAVFLLLPATVFRMTGVVPPNHLGYVQFPALLLLIFAAMFFRAATNPAANRDVIAYGMALKASYFGLVFWYQFHGGIPALWVPWAWADVAFFLLFFVAWRSVVRK